MFSLIVIIKDFYENFVSEDNTIKLQLITNKEVATPSEARLCIGNFETFIHTDSNYLNFNNFEPMMINTDRHISDRLDFTSTGLELGGYSGFSFKDNEQNLKFRESFQDPINNQWDLTNGITDRTIEYIQYVNADASVDTLYPLANYGDSPNIPALNFPG